MVKKLSFDFKNGEEEVKLAVRMPTTKEENTSEMEQSRVFGAAIDGGVKVSEALMNSLVEQKVWGKDKEGEIEELSKRVKDNIHKLRTGKNGEERLRKVDGKNIAVEIINDRAKIDEINSILTRKMSFTAEGMAQNAKFNCLVALCTVYNDSNERYFKSVDDYKNRANDADAELAANKFYELYYGLKDDPRKELPEYKFLLKYEFVNDKLHFLDELKRPTTMDGKFLIRNEDGRYIDEDGQLINASGDLVDESGEVIVESVDFLD